jgi:Transposase DDE domain
MSQATSARHQRQHLHFDALVQLARQRFDQIPDQRRAPDYSLTDALTAGLALFSLKDPSLLAFCRRAVDRNLRSVFGLVAIPSDTQMREILDEVEPDHLRPLFKDVFRQLQRGKVLEDYVFLDGYYLVALDGVEYFCSHKVHCDHCMTRRHSNGEVSYYHQMLGAVIIHPDFPEVIPLFPEPIQRQDGHKKNDCERNAARRWLKHLRQDHPHLKVMVVEDALSSNAPHIRDLRARCCSFILGVKEADHEYLFKQFYQRLDADQVEELEVVDAGTGIIHSYLFVNGLTLNEANQDVEVNFLKYMELHPDGQERVWTWVVEMELTRANVPWVMRGGRCRWRIENETFNTLKNQGYHFEHNFGHGYKHLCVVLALLMMAAFLIDQVQQKCNALFRQARAKKGPKCALWEAVRNLFSSFEVSSMRDIYEAIAYGYERPHLKPLVEQAMVAGRQAPNTS